MLSQLLGVSAQVKNMQALCMRNILRKPTAKTEPSSTCTTKQGLVTGRLNPRELNGLL